MSKKLSTFIFMASVLLFECCGHENNNSASQSNTNNNDSLVNISNSNEGEIEYINYLADGIFLKGDIQLFDNNQKLKETLKVDKITPVQILAKSSKMYNLEGDNDDCKKGYFLKIKFQGKDYTVFGQDIYEINNQQKFTAHNSKNENLTLFPITSFKMGAIDDDGLSGCEDYSILVLFNEKQKQYSLMKFPNNDEIRGTNQYKYATIFHDDMAYDSIYKLSIHQDTLIAGIKSNYQEGGATFNLKIYSLGESYETKISDEIRYEEEEFKKFDELK